VQHAQRQLLLYTKTKEALVQAVDSYLTGLIVERQLKWSASESATPAEQLHAHLAGIQHLLQQYPSIFIALHELYVRSLRDRAVQQILEIGDQGWHGYLAGVLQAGVMARSRMPAPRVLAFWLLMLLSLQFVWACSPTST
jgi:hypothetical protein